MDDLYTRIVNGRGGLENLLSKLPGFKGYVEKTARRQADRLMREHVAAKLREQLNRLAQIEKALVDAGGLKFMSDTRSAKTKFQTFIDRIATDAPGYSGFFDAVKITDEDLQVVYAFDEALLDYVEQFKVKLAALDTAVSSGEGVVEAIRELDTLTIEANEAYSLRDGVLNGIE
ncbi:MAG: hypothetical protein K8S97_12460 [Anaerolineae bacterium]|nr:hypothetical protein [Anaerolineae bacterium]